MKNIVVIICLLLVWKASFSSEHDVTFVITSDCVSSVEAKKSKYIDAWDLAISLNKETASKIFKLSIKNIGNKLTIYDGSGVVVISAIVMEPLPASFVSSGIESKEEALKAKKSILESTGKCGLK